VLKALAPNVTHHFAGDHALGGVTTQRRCAFGSIGLARCCPTYDSTSETFGLRARRGGRRS
jgi:hypothetical protein